MPGLSELKNRSARRGEEASKSQNVFPKIETLAWKRSENNQASIPKSTLTQKGGA
jgi:hypothetical protein